MNKRGDTMRLGRIEKVKKRINSFLERPRDKRRNKGWSKLNKKRREIKVIKRLEEEKRRNYEVETDRKRE